MKRMNNPINPLMKATGKMIGVATGGAKNMTKVATKTGKHVQSGVSLGMLHQRKK